MFLLRWLKKLLFLAVIAGLLWWGAHYKIGDQTLYQKAKSWVASPDVKEGFKDFRMFVGGLLKSLGEEIQEDVTEEDKRELEKMIRKKAREKNGSDGF